MWHVSVPGLCRTQIARIFSGSGSLVGSVGRIDIAKVLVFDESMQYILLKKEDVFTPLGDIIKSHDLFNEARRIMALKIGMPEDIHPPWWHIRTECFPAADTYMHVFFGKIQMAELQGCERFAKDTMIIESKAVVTGSKPVAHRLKYLVPMAIVLSATDSRHWPKP
jgi:hypothetical protein